MMLHELHAAKFLEWVMYKQSCMYFPQTFLKATQGLQGDKRCPFISVCHELQNFLLLYFFEHAAYVHCIKSARQLSNSRCSNQPPLQMWVVHIWHRTISHNLYREEGAISSWLWKLILNSRPHAARQFLARVFSGPLTAHWQPFPTMLKKCIRVFLRASQVLMCRWLLYQAKKLVQ